MSNVYKQDLNASYNEGRLNFNNQISGKIEILSPDGRLIYMKKINSPVKHIDVSLNNGVYLFRLTDKSYIYTGKFVAKEI